jgi:hypothetical protein
MSFGRSFARVSDFADGQMGFGHSPAGVPLPITFHRLWAHSSELCLRQSGQYGSGTTFTAILTTSNSKQHFSESSGICSICPGQEFPSAEYGIRGNSIPVRLELG